jgi:histidinol-phosphatase (PHP family)
VKVDFHFHLEEGPYSLQWLQRTGQALANTTNDDFIAGKSHTRDWIDKICQMMLTRMEQGCFHENWIQRYLQKGRERGIQRFGVVDHIYRFVEFKHYFEQFMLLDDTPLGRLQHKWLDQVCTCSIETYLKAMRKIAEREDDLSIGVEADFFIGGEKQLQALLAPYELDYVIGSVHFLDGWGFDNPEARDRFHTADLESLYDRHYDTVKQAIASGLFDFIAHLDNLKVFGFRPDEAKLLPKYREIASSLNAAGIGSEINTGLLYRYPVKEMCPSPSFLQALFEQNVPITLSSDAHFPDDIGMHLDDALNLAKSTGYREIAVYKNRQRFMLPISEEKA